MEPSDIQEYRVEWATYAHGRGWALTPLDGKRPILPGWTDKPKPELSGVRAWAKARNIGLRTGQVSGVVVIDEDRDDGGDAGKLGLPDTVTVARGENKHYYFSIPSGSTIGNSAGKLGPGIDVKGDGGQVVFPGSIHPDTGQPYLWLEGKDPKSIDLAELPRAVLEIVTKKPPENPPDPFEDTKEIPLVPLENLPRPYVQAAIRKGVEAVLAAPEGARNDTLNRETFGLAQIAPKDEVEKMMEQIGQEAGLAPSEVFATVKSAVQSAEKKPRIRSASSGPMSPEAQKAIARHEVENEEGKPKIVIRNEMPIVIEEAEKALIESGILVFRRLGNLVRISKDDTSKIKWLTRPPGSPYIERADKLWVRNALAEAAVWIKVSQKGKFVVEEYALPPAWAGETICAKGTWPFPYLEGITQTPLLRLDGSILSKKGYDSETGFYFSPDIEYEYPGETPTRGDAENSCARIFDLVSDFPFLEPNDRAAFLAALLTLVGREAIRGPAPFFAIRAPAPGSGKSLLADVIGIIGTGRECPRMVYPKDDDELRKRITAISVEGLRLCLFDNIDGIIGSQSISAATTGQVWHDRILGKSEMVAPPIRTVWMGTGNNIRFRGDMGRRVIPIDIDPQCEAPEARTGFKHVPLVEYVSAHRAEYLRHAMTILRAHIVSGSPGHKEAEYGSFENWDRVIRRAVMWITGTDPIAGNKRVKADADVESENLSKLFSGWSESIGDRAVTTPDIIESSENNGTLKEALMFLDPRGKGENVASIGGKLAHLCGRIRDGKRIVKCSVGHGLTRWKIESLQAQTVSVPVPPQELAFPASQVPQEAVSVGNNDNGSPCPVCAATWYWEGRDGKRHCGRCEAPGDPTVEVVRWITKNNP